MKTTIDTSDVQQLELQPAHVPTEAEEKIEAQRKRVLSAVTSGHLDTMQERVAWILNHYFETRDFDIVL